LGIDESAVGEVLKSFRKAKVKEDKCEIEEGGKIWKILIKYFVHGIAFSLLFTVLGIAWIFGLLALVMIGSFLGLIIGLGLLILIVGFVNAVITTQLWFAVKSGFWDILLHGLVLFIALVLVNGIFVIAPSLAFPGIATTVVTFIIGSFIDGFVGKKVAGWWEQEFEEEVSQAVEAKWTDKKL